MDGIDASSAATENPTSASHETYPAVKVPYAEGLRWSGPSWGISGTTVKTSLYTEG